MGRRRVWQWTQAVRGQRCSVRALAEAVRGEAEVIVTAEDGHRAVAMGVAAQMAAAEARVVSMQEVGL